MHSRLLAGWKGLTLATAVAGLVLLSLPWTQTFAATPDRSSGSGGLGPKGTPQDELPSKVITTKR